LNDVNASKRKDRAVSRGIICTARPYAVWLGVTAVAAAAALTVPGSWRAAGDARAAETIPQVLVAACATGLALSLAWLWVVTSVTVAEVVTGAGPRGGGATRRLVLLACGAAVVAGTALPAQASSGDGAEVLVGLPLPERAVAPATSGRPSAPVASVATTTADAYVVRPGDSLWSIARAHPAPADDVETRWRAIWRQNRAVVGDDPDLIHPGQALRLPDTDTSTEPGTEPGTEKDGERR
jgi:LysM repeat protein